MLNIAQLTSSNLLMCVCYLWLAKTAYELHRNCFYRISKN
nr:MAG TPA: hypothetical protein [Caudoviricetes sp.]